MISAGLLVAIGADMCRAFYEYFTSVYGRSPR
jgi:hypothetical protein